MAEEIFSKAEPGRARQPAGLNDCGMDRLVDGTRRLVHGHKSNFYNLAASVILLEIDAGGVLAVEFKCDAPQIF